MKYYLPTTTLNFDGILSSQMIAPAGMYRPDTLWWNRFELATGQRRDALALYSKIPTWTIDDPDRDNYPLVIEFDKAVFKAKKSDAQEYVLSNGFKALVVTMPISFTALDFAQGHVRFIFRTEDEMNRMLVKASTSVAECKIVASILFDSPGAFCVLPKSKRNATFPLSSMVGLLEERLSRVPDAEDLEYPSEVVREERERGASLGYQVGRYAKSLRSGTFTDAFREPLPYHEWKAKVLPQPFEAVLDNLCARPMQAWDPNRSAIVAFCRDRWNDCFADSKVAGKKVVEGTPLHASLQSIAQHWASPEKAYRISAERDPYMQALAAFLECGTQANKYPRFAKESLLKSPEYLLALYGALVGYTSFSRVLLDNRMYLPPPPKPVVTSGEPSQTQNAKGVPRNPRCNPAADAGRGEKSPEENSRGGGMRQEQSAGDSALTTETPKIVHQDELFSEDEIGED